MKQALQDLIPAIRFFAENSGYAIPPGRMACARHLAEAERDAELVGITYEWVIDEAGCSGCQCGNPRCKCSSGQDHDTLACVARNETGNVLASLGGVCSPSPEYKRVVEAELALESLTT